MAYELDTFDRTTPAGPGGGTHGNPSYELGADWISWNASATSNGCVIFSGKMTQFESFSFHTVAINVNPSTGDDQAVRFQITSLMKQVWVQLRVHDDVVSGGAAANLDVDAKASNGSISMRIQMDQGTPGQVTIILDGSYQGPTNISGSTSFLDNSPHICEARVIGNTVSLLVDGVQVFSRSDMGTLPAGSTRRYMGIQWAGDSDQPHVENWESGDHPLSTGPAEDITPNLFAAGAISAAATGTSITSVIPAGDAADDILIHQVWCNAASTFTPGGSWVEMLDSGGGSTAVNSANMSAAWFWLRASGSDGNPTVTTSATGSSSIGLYGRVWVYRRCLSSGTPFEDATAAGAPTLSTTPQSAAIDTTGTDRLVVCHVSVDDDNTLTGMPNEWLDHGGRVFSTTGGDGMSDGIQRWMRTAGNVAAVTAGTMASDYWRTLTFALLPDAGGTPTLVVADALHAHTVDNVALTQHNALVVADALHGHTVDAVALTQHNLLAVDEALHGHTVDNVDLTVGAALVVADALQAHTVDNVDLVQHHVLAVDDALHAHSADNATLTAAGGLTVQNALQAHSVDAVVLTQHHVLAVDDALQGHTVDNVALGQSSTLVVADALHAHTVDAVVLTQHVVLTVAETVHGHTVDALALTQHHTLEVADAFHAHSADPALFQIPIVGGTATGGVVWRDSVLAAVGAAHTVTGGISQP